MLDFGYCLPIFPGGNDRMARTPMVNSLNPKALEYKISEHSGPKYEKYLTETLLLYDMGLFHKISWKNYAKKLSRSILKKKPSLAS